MLNAVSKIRKEIVLKAVLGAVLIGLGVASRTILSRNFASPLVPLFGNNFEVVTVIGVVAGLIFGLRYGWIVPLAIMVGSDLLLGNDSTILVLTWTGFVIPAVLGGLIKHFAGKLGKDKVTITRSVGGFGSSLFSVLFFFAWTNFGVWLFWYPKTVEGLLRCYTLALPFLANQIKGNLIAAGLVFGLYFAYSCLIKRNNHGARTYLFFWQRKKV